MSKFTRGPWVRVSMPRGEHENYWLIETHATGRTIADMPDNSDEDKANAQLVIHAPDMFSLLKQIRQWDHLEGAGDGPFWKMQIDAVLAKARGEQP